MYETKPYFYGTGRRKDSVARVRVYTGTGKITINDRDIDNYFGLETLKLIVRSPLVLLGLEGKYDVVVRVFRRRCFRSGWRYPPRPEPRSAAAERGEPCCSEEGRLPDPRSSYEGT